MATLKNEASVWVRVAIEVISLRGPSVWGPVYSSVRPADPCIPEGLPPSRIGQRYMQKLYRASRGAGLGDSRLLTVRLRPANAREYPVSSRSYARTG